MPQRQPWASMLMLLHSTQPLAAPPATLPLPPFRRQLPHLTAGGSLPRPAARAGHRLARAVQVRAAGIGLVARLPACHGPLPLPWAPAQHAPMGRHAPSAARRGGGAAAEAMLPCFKPEAAAAPCWGGAASMHAGPPHRISYSTPLKPAPPLPPSPPPPAAPTPCCATPPASPSCASCPWASWSWRRVGAPRGLHCATRGRCRATGPGAPCRCCSCGTADTA